MELKTRDGLARICEFETPHGVIETPTVLPVINPNLNVMDIREMRKTGVQAVITNSYIIRRSDSLRKAAVQKGIHGLLDFDGPVMTDSGTFQSYVYGDFEFDNVSQVEFQEKIGSDIGTIVDIFSTPDDAREKAENAVHETYKRYLETEKGKMILSAPVQGSVYMDLRRRAGRLMSSANPGYFAIGGVVPLLESYRYDTLVDIIGNVKRSIDPSKPVHLFGAGHPMFIPLAVLMGIDMFDSASYVKYARDNRLLFSDGTRDLSRLHRFPEWSPLCSEYRPPDLLELDQDERVRLLSEHNLVAIFNEINEVKERIREQSLWNYVEMRSGAHPSLFRAFRRFLGHHAEQYSYELSRKTPFYYYDRNSLKHPIVKHIRDFTADYLERRKKPTVLLRENQLPPADTRRDSLRGIYENYDVNVMLSWNGMAVPVELCNTYPVQQYLTSGLYGSGTDGLKSYISRLTGGNRVFDAGEIQEFANLRHDSFRNMEREFLRVVSEYQFGIEDGSLLIGDGSFIRVSRKTGRIRTVQSEGEIIATLRPSDGLLTLTYGGGRLLDTIAPGRHMRVYVTDDSAEYNEKGLNVFAKFVTGSDRTIRPGNEVLVMNGKSLVAVGRALLNGVEMMHFKKGLAVNVHQGRGTSA